MTFRERLPNRRQCQTIEFQHAGQSFTLTTGVYQDGRLAEIFLSARHIGSPLEALARDGAILISIALQHSANLETIRSALSRDHDGGPATLLGAALDSIEGAGR